MSNKHYATFTPDEKKDLENQGLFSGFWCPEGDSKYSNKAMILLVFSLVWFCLLTNLLTNLLTYGAAGGAGSDESSAAHTVNSRYFMPVFEEM